MYFSESNKPFQPIPSWAKFLIDFGYSWRRAELSPTKRRIAIVSMPCDSAAAGLISLGALINDLGNPKANDIDGHYKSILRYAHQFLNFCRDCELAECEPRVKRCGFSHKASGQVRSPLYPRKIFSVSDRTDFQTGQIAWETRGRGNSGPAISFPDPDYAINWQIEGEAPVQINAESEKLTEAKYDSFYPQENIVADNLERSYSGLCLAGRVTGETATKERINSISFKFGFAEHNLSELLTIKNWSRNIIVSRITFFNTRTGKMDRSGTIPGLVVADGDNSFLRVLSCSEFQQSDVIGVMHRSIERDRLEDVGNKISSLRQWYQDGVDFNQIITSAPRGMGVMVLER